MKQTSTGMEWLPISDKVTKCGVCCALIKVFMVMPLSHKSGNCDKASGSRLAANFHGNVIHWINIYHDAGRVAMIFYASSVAGEL